MSRSTDVGWSASTRTQGARLPPQVDVQAHDEAASRGEGLEGMHTGSLP